MEFKSINAKHLYLDSTRKNHIFAEQDGGTSAELKPELAGGFSGCTMF